VVTYTAKDPATRPNQPYSPEETRRRRKAIRERHRRMLEEALGRLGSPLLAHQNYCRLRDLDALFFDRYGYDLGDTEDGRNDAYVLGHQIARILGEDEARHWIGANCSWMSAVRVNALLRDIRNRPRKWSADKLGRRLRLFYADRQRLQITTIGSIDVDKAQRERLRRDRWNATKRANREQSREQYLKNHDLMRRAPWEALGCSHRTWRRLRKKLNDAGLPRDEHSVASAYARGRDQGSASSRERHGHSQASGHVHPDGHSAASAYKTPVLTPHPGQTSSPPSKAKKKGAFQGVIELPAVPKSNGLHPGGRPPMRGSITLTAFPNGPNAIRYRAAVAADVLASCRDYLSEGVMFEVVRGKLRFHPGGPHRFKPLKHQAGQIDLPAAMMRSLGVRTARFNKTECWFAITNGLLDMAPPFHRTKAA
jgi:hypothetical protein